MYPEGHRACDCRVLALQAQLESRGDLGSADEGAAELARLHAIVSQLQGDSRSGSGTDTDRLLSEIKLQRRQVQEVLHTA